MISIAMKYEVLFILQLKNNKYLRDIMLGCVIDISGLLNNILI